MPQPAAARRGIVVVALAAAVALTSGCGSAMTPAPASSRPAAASTPSASSPAGLDDPAKKTIAMELVSSAENSSLDWEAQYGYIEDIGDGRGYTGGIIGFTSGTGDMREVVQAFTDAHPGNPLAPFLPALERVDGTASHEGLGDAFVAAWEGLGDDAGFRAAQDEERDRVYFDPAVALAKEDGLRALGQFAYYDAIVVHGPGDPGDWPNLQSIRARAMDRAKTPAKGGDETAYLRAFLDVRVDAMHEEAAHDDTSRVDTAQRRFLDEGNLDLDPPLRWHVYGDPYEIP
jgi:chitosanase